MSKILLTPNFSVQELRCPCCKVCNVEQETLRKLQQLRKEYNSPMIINSACRCPDHNKKVGGALRSQHVTTEQHPGHAFDVHMDEPVRRARFVRLAMENGFNGIGIYDNFIHIDDRDGHPVMWVG